MEKEYTYEEFRVFLQEQLSDAFGDYNATVGFAKIPKDNAVKDALYVRLDKDSPIAPVIYTEPLYEEYASGKALDQIIADTAVDVSRGFRNTDLPELTVENADKSIRFSLVNANRNEELLSRCPHIEMEDLAAVPRWIINEEQSFVVTNDLAQHLLLTREEVMDIARRNTESMDFSIRNMNDILGDAMLSMGVDDDYAHEILSENKSPLYVVTSKTGMDGSAAMMSDRALQQIGNTLGENYAILPSSRHEILCVADSQGLEPEELHQMVYAINRTEVAPGDYLSDMVYHYDRATHTLDRLSEPGVPLYRYDREYALDRGEQELYRDSLRENIRCRDAIENSIRNGFDGAHLDSAAADRVLREFGSERTQYVLAATVDSKSWDGRFSDSNKVWAASLHAEYPDADRFIVQSHPAVLDGYINQVRESVTRQAETETLTNAEMRCSM